MSAALRSGAGWTLHHADYRETLRLAAEQGGCDLVATSPPYCDARTYGAAVSWGDADYAALGDAVWAALKPGGHALINVDAPVRDWTRDGRGTERGMHPWRLMLDWHDRIGFRVPDQLVFGRMGQPGFWPMGFRRDHEPLLWFQKPGSGYFSHISDQATGAGGGVRTRRNKDGTKTSQTNIIPQATKYRGTLWQYGVCGNGHTGAPDIEAADHPARWPFRLADDIVRCFCPPAGLICDPFTGAGTTAAAAIANGRRFIGGDLYARNDGRRWIDIAAEILNERQRQQSLFPPILGAV